jgi:hypothetical protein
MCFLHGLMCVADAEEANDANNLRALALRRRVVDPA